MSRPSPKSLVERLAEGVVVGAEGYVFELERRGYVKAGPYVPEVILDEPEALRQLHREFLRAGSDVMVALTYYAHRDKLADVGRADDLEAMNRGAVRLANEVAAEGGALVAGNICNTWAFDPADAEASGAVVRAQYEEQLGWAVEEGVDFVIAETNDYVGEALIALDVCQELGLPAMVTFASVQPTDTYDGYDYVDACRILADAGATIVGLNCSRGPATMLPLLERIRAAVDVAVAAQPVPYRTSTHTPAFESLAAEDGRRLFPIQLEPYQCTRFEMADFARRARDIGVDYIGICCGGGPHHVRAMAEALGRSPVAGRYSPALELHPVLGAPRDGGHEVMGNWAAGHERGPGVASSRVARHLGRDDGPAAGWADDAQAAVERLHAIGQPAQPRPQPVVAPPTPSSLTSMHAERPLRHTRTVAVSACEYLATLASASHATKYAASSTGPGSRSLGSYDTVVATVARVASAFSADPRPCSSTAGCSPRASSRSSCSECCSSSAAVVAISAPAGSLRRRFWSNRSCSATATSRCWAPSWRLRSSRRRSESPASTIRAREPLSSSSRARSSTFSRTFSSAIAAAPATASSRIGSS